MKKILTILSLTIIFFASIEFAHYSVIKKELSNNQKKYFPEVNFQMNYSLSNVLGSCSVKPNTTIKINYLKVRYYTERELKLLFIHEAQHCKDRAVNQASAINLELTTPKQLLAMTQE